MIKNKILENLYNKLLEESKKPEAGEALKNLCGSLEAINRDNAMSVLNGSVLNGGDGGSLEERYTDLLEQCNDYIRDHADAASDQLKAAMVPMRSYIDLFHKIGLGEINDMTLQQVLWNDHVIDGLLNTDEGPKAPEHEEPVQTEFADPADAWAKYREITSYAEQNMKRHLGAIAGEPVNGRPYEVLNAKAALLSEVANENASNPEQLRQFIQIDRLGSLVHSSVDGILPEKFDPIRRIVNRTNMDWLFDSVFDYTKFSGDVEHFLPKDSASVKAIKKNLKSLRTTYKSLGFSENEMDQLAACEKAVFAPVTVLKLMKDPVTFSEDIHNERYNAVITEIEGLEQKLEDFLKGNGDAPGTEDYRKLFQAGIDHVNTHSILYSTRQDPNCVDEVTATLSKAAKSIGDTMPGLKADIDKYLGAVQAKYDAEVSELVGKIGDIGLGADNPKGKDMLRDCRLKVNYLLDKGLMPVPERDYINLIFMEKDPGTLDSALANAARTLQGDLKKTSPENWACYGTLVSKKEFYSSCIRTQVFGNVMKAFMQMPEDSANLPTIFKNLRNAGSFTREQTEELMDYMRQLELHPKMQMLLHASDEDLKKAMKPEILKAFCEQTFIKDKTPFKPFDKLQIPEETISALTQKSGNLGVKNSAEYNAVSAALKTLKGFEVPEGVDAKNPVYMKKCLELYKACAQYVRTHDSKAASSNGRLRFAKAAEIMAELTLPLMEAMPGQREAIEQDIQLNMVRSKEYRDLLAERANKGLNDLFTKSSGKTFSARTYGELTDAQKAQMDTFVKTIAYKGIVDQSASKIVGGKLDTEQKVEALSRHTGRMFAKAEEALFEYKERIAFGNVKTKTEPEPVKEKTNESPVSLLS